MSTGTNRPPLGAALWQPPVEVNRAPAAAITEPVASQQVGAKTRRRAPTRTDILGELHRAIGVLKKRLSDFERTMREIEITHYGVNVGRPLTDLRGILTGTPELLQHPAGGER